MLPAVLSLGIVLSVAGPAGRFAVGDELEQTVTVGRRSAYQVSDNALAQATRYSLASKLTVTAVKPDGGVTVKQVVTDARLIEADETMRTELADALKKAVGGTFELTVGPTGEVSEFRGPKDALRVQKADAAGGQTLRVWSVLDADAWKELAGLTFIAPDPARPTWDRPMSHDWGPLGGWAGRTHFARKETGRYEFRHALSYRPPKDGNDLPVRIVQPRFVLVEAGGSIRWDAAVSRVTAADETFRVRGTATVVVAGQAVGVEMEEAQRFEVRVRKPGEGMLKAGPADR